MILTRRGGALPLVLILLLALTGLAVGTFHLALGELRTVSASRHAWKATHAARGSLVRGLILLDSLLQEGNRPKGGTILGAQTPEGLELSARLLWLDQEFFLLEGVGGSRDWPGARELMWVGWSLSPPSRVGAFQAALEVGEAVHVQGSAAIETLPADSAPSPSPAGVCGPYLSVLDSLFRGGALPPWAPLPTEEAVEEGSEPGIPGLGLLGGSTVLAWAQEPASGSPGPDLGTRGEPGCPGGGTIELRGMPGNATLRGETVCGLMVVGGNLIVQEGARLLGMALVGGDLTLEGDGTLEGLARIQGAATLTDGSRFVGAPCLALWALDRLPGLHRPYLPPDGYRIHGF